MTARAAMPFVMPWSRAAEAEGERLPAPGCAVVTDFVPVGTSE